jgi:hypothetical protein
MITTKNKESKHSRPSFDIEAVVISAPARTAWEEAEHERLAADFWRSFEAWRLAREALKREKGHGDV